MKLFSLVNSKICHPSIHFNNKSVQQVPSRKHLGIILDTKLNFQELLKNILNKVNKTIGLLQKLQNIFPHGPLYKSFIRSHLDNSDVNYDQYCNNYFQQKLKSIQYNVALAITGTIRSSFREKPGQKLALETLQQQ